MSKQLTPYQRIVRNAEVGKGVHLTAEEVEAMALDEAIRQLARNDDNDDARRKHHDR